MPHSERIVFVVDDEHVIAQTLGTILNQACFAATTFDHPQEAIKAANTTKPDLLISDVMMPGMTGVELAILFQTMHPECKILLFSGHASTTNLMDDAPFLYF